MPVRPVITRCVLLGLAAILLIAIIEKWGLYFGFNLKFYEVALLLLMPVALCQVVFSARESRLPSALLTVIVLKLGYFVLLLLSTVPVLATSLADDTLGFLIKGLIQAAFRLAFFILVILSLVGFSEAQRRRLLAVHFFAVTLSACYGLAQGAVMFWRNVDLDRQISLLLEPFTGAVGPDLSRYAYGPFYRLNGLAGDPNLQAAYAITAVPLFAALFLIRPRWYLAVLLGLHALMLCLTMSLSGLAGLLVGLALVVIFSWHHLKPVHFLQGGLLLALAVFAVVTFREPIEHLVSVRTDPAGTASEHSKIAMESLRIYRQYPLGVGYNNFSLAWRALSKEYPDRAMNPHNTYLAILVESGPLALACELVTYVFMIVVALRTGTAFAKIFAATLIGMCVAALAYETLEMFYAQLFIFLGFTCTVLGDEVWLKRPRTAPRSVRPPAASRASAPA